MGIIYLRGFNIIFIMLNRNKIPRSPRILYTGVFFYMQKLICCPLCKNSNSMTFGKHYAWKKNRKSVIDYDNEFYLCLECDYKSETFPVGSENKSEKQIIIMKMPPKIQKVEGKVKVIVEIDRSALDEVLSSMQSAGFNDVRVQFGNG